MLSYCSIRLHDHLKVSQNVANHMTVLDITKKSCSQRLNVQDYVNVWYRCCQAAAVVQCTYLQSLPRAHFQSGLILCSIRCLILFIFFYFFLQKQLSELGGKRSLKPHYM